jgi:hypothetical protein
MTRQLWRREHGRDFETISRQARLVSSLRGEGATWLERGIPDIVPIILTTTRHHTVLLQPTPFDQPQHRPSRLLHIRGPTLTSRLPNMAAYDNIKWSVGFRKGDDRLRGPQKSHVAKSMQGVIRRCWRASS